MSNKTFVEAFQAGEVDVGKIHDYIEYWHTHETGNSLREFLGMTYDQYNAWVKVSDVMLAKILQKTSASITEVPVCKNCGCELGVLVDGTIYFSSSYIESDFCYECQVEYCLDTDCLTCEMGKHPDCKHLSRKKFYQEENKEN